CLMKSSIEGAARIGRTGERIDPNCIDYVCPEGVNDCALRVTCNRVHTSEVTRCPGAGRWIPDEEIFHLGACRIGHKNELRLGLSHNCEWSVGIGTQCEWPRAERRERRRRRRHVESIEMLDASSRGWAAGEEEVPRNIRGQNIVSGNSGCGRTCPSR